MADSSVLGRILWYELLTTDMDAAEQFYTAVVGWAKTPFEGSPQRYDMWMRAGSVPVGGVMTIPEGMRFLVDLRAELLPHLKSDKRLLPLDAELETLFSTWFDVAFLEPVAAGGVIAPNTGVAVGLQFLTNG